MTKTQAIQHGKRKHRLQLRRNRKNKALQLQRTHEKNRKKRLAKATL
jgi:hypothetical protein